MGNKGGKQKAAKPTKGGTKSTPAPNSQPTETVKVKLLLIGDSGVGKSALLFRFIDNTYSDNHITNIGGEGEAREKQMVIETPTKKANVNLSIWDTGGQERFRNITSSFYQGANGVMIIYDITSEDSWAQVQKWNNETERYAPGAAKILIGNKLDLSKERAVPIEKAREFASSIEVPYLEVSAKEPNLGDNVNKSFEKMVIAVLEILDEQD